MKKNMKQKKIQRMTMVRSVALLMGLLDSDTWRCKMQGHELCSHMGESEFQGWKSIFIVPQGGVIRMWVDTGSAA